MSEAPFPAKASPGGCILAVKVQPRSSQSRIVGVEGEFLKVKLHAPPEDGKANLELIEVLHRALRVARQNIKILRGDKSRSKWVEIQGLNPAEARAAVLSLHKS
ncbi:MAG: DUF167 domain-containing protein [bacterium]